MEGAIVMYYGPMFSGKTSSIVKMGLQSAGNVLMISPKLDTRHKYVITHDGYLAPFTTIKTILLRDVNCKGFGTVCIDECQFIMDAPVQVPLIAKHARVYVACLDTDSKKNNFEVFTALLPKCTEAHHLHAKCVYCKKDACYTRRKALREERIVIGGTELYEPVCAACWEACAQVCEWTKDPMCVPAGGH